MARIKAGDVTLGWREWGKGETTVLFVHGNLASKDWLDLSARFFPAGVRTIGVDWRGCGESDRPTPDPDYANYSMRQHAEDMIAALDALGVAFCHIATHSTGGIIAAHMLLMQPERFGKVLHLDPVSPAGLAFGPDQIGVFEAMSHSRDVTRAVMATAAASLFDAGSLTPGHMPHFGRAASDASRALFDHIIDQTFGVSNGIWIGTPLSLDREYKSGELAARMKDIHHDQLILWGELDGWIPKPDLERMAREMPHCRLVVLPNIGHSANIEAPQLYAGYFGAWFGGLSR